MYRVRIATVALLSLFVLTTLSNAAEKGAKKKGKGAAGTVKSVAADGKSIVVAVRVKKETEDKTYAVAGDVKVTINGESKTIGDVEEGAKVRLKLSDDGQTVTDITIGRKKKKAA